MLRRTEDTGYIISRDFISIIRSQGIGKIQPMLKLADAAVVVGVFDSDNKCILELLRRHAPNGWAKPFGSIIFAVDEAESWLLADRASFASFFGVRSSLIPTLKSRNKELSNAIPYKTSLFILTELAPYSSKKKVRDSLKMERIGKKPATYNNLWPDYIRNHWDISRAMKNSESLKRTVERIHNRIKQFSAR